MFASHRLVLPALLALALVPGAAGAQTPAPADATAGPRNVILMIPDGCGPAAVGLGRLAAGRPLSLDSILVGAVQTRPAGGRITDSAASATAFATGVKTRNAMLALDPEGRQLGTLIEAAITRGLATGLVTTTRITHATPAAFVSHVEDRGFEDSIAVQMLDHRVSVLLGGGQRHWLPEGEGGGRTDGRDLLAAARRMGYTVVSSRSQLAAADEAPLLGLFSSGHMDFEVDRDTTAQPSLTEMTERAIALLSRREAGFFLVVEGGRIDHAAHEWDPGTEARDVLAYDAALRAAIAFARRDGRTLLVSVADHETGGLGLGRTTEGEKLYAGHSESPLAVRASAERMLGAVREGSDVIAVVERGTGIHDLSDQEKATLRTSAADGDRFFATLGAIESRRAGVGWTTGGHTSLDVGLYAYGPGRERFIGLHENTDVARLIAELLGLDLAAETARLRTAARTAPRR